VLGAAVLAGLIAGAITSAFHFVLAEPVIERAIEQEKETKMAQGANSEAPIVSRTVQRRGLVIGLLIYGACWGGLFGVLYLVIESRRQLWDPRIRGWLLAVAVYAVALYLAMPANPDPVRMPADLVWTFRAISLAGLVVFWLALGTSFQWLARARA
jgi:hypothetical protein